MTVAAAYTKKTKVDGTTVPSAGASLALDGQIVEDTNFLTSGGFKTKLVGLMNWTLSQSGKLGRAAGYLTTIKKAGSTTAATDLAMTLVSGTTATYQINDATKRVLDPAVTPTFEDGGVAINSGTIVSIDYLFGRVTLTGAASGAVTMATGSYFPMTDFGYFNSFELGLKADVLDASTFRDLVANSGTRVNKTGLIEATLKMDGPSNRDFAHKAILLARDPILIEIAALNGIVTFRGWWLLPKNKTEGEIAAMEMEGVELELAGVYDQNFGYLATSTFNAGLAALMTKLFSRAVAAVQYLPDGTNGLGGNGYVSSFNVKGDHENVPEWDAEIVSGGALTAVP